MQSRVIQINTLGSRSVRYVCMYEALHKKHLKKRGKEIVDVS